MLAIQIQDEEIENIFVKRFKSNKDEFVNFIKQTLKTTSDVDTLSYVKKDPMAHMTKLQSDAADGECTNPFKDIEDVVAYSNKLRESSWK